VVSLYSAACVDPKELQIILGRLLGAELKLSIAFLPVLVSSTRYVFEEDLRVALSVR
jgi:hypothetical protein